MHFRTSDKILYVSHRLTQITKKQHYPWYIYIHAIKNLLLFENAISIIVRFFLQILIKTLSTVLSRKAYYFYFFCFLLSSVCSICWYWFAFYLWLKSGSHINTIIECSCVGSHGDDQRGECHGDGASWCWQGPAVWSVPRCVRYAGS